MGSGLRRMTATLIRGDARDLPLADESVDLVVTSPPYFGLRSYQDGGDHFDGQVGAEESPQDFLAALWACTAEMVRVLKPCGSIFVNLGDKYAGSGGHNNAGISKRNLPGMGTGYADREKYVTGVSAKSTLRGNGHVGGGPKIKATRRSAPDRYNQNSGGVRRKSLIGFPWRYAIGCIDDLDLILRAELIWDKPNGLPESVTDRVRRSHEHWFHFTKEPEYFSAMDEVREPHAPWTAKAYEYERANGGYDRKVNEDRNDGGQAENYAVLNPLGKIPGSVWRISFDPLRAPDHLDVDHFAAFPQEWPRRLILGWSPANGVVLDPFVGSGTVPMVARALGRFGIGVDLSADYLKLAQWRIFESGHAKKSVSRMWAERQGALL